MPDKARMASLTIPLGHLVQHPWCGDPSPIRCPSQVELTHFSGAGRNIALKLARAGKEWKAAAAVRMPEARGDIREIIGEPVFVPLQKLAITYGKAGFSTASTCSSHIASSAGSQFSSVRLGQLTALLLSEIGQRKNVMLALVSSRASHMVPLGPCDPAPITPPAIEGQCMQL